jgi:Zn-dependent membrane protease YugP
VLGLFDPLWLLLMVPAMLLAGWAQYKVKSAYAKASKIPVRSGLTGAQAAERILKANGLLQVGIEAGRGVLGDHYDPRHKVLRLSPDVYNGRSLAAVGIAAHEAGHAIQDGVGYAPLAIRNGIVPLANIGTQFAFVLFFLGFLVQWMFRNGAMAQGMMVAAIILFSAVVVFQLINLPVEFNASTRARAVLLNNGIITAAEDPVVKRVLNAAAMTYVAATITAILQLLYMILRSGLLDRR